MAAVYVGQDRLQVCVFVCTCVCVRKGVRACERAPLCVCARARACAYARASSACVFSERENEKEGGGTFRVYSPCHGERYPSLFTPVRKCTRTNGKGGQALMA